MAQNLEKNTKIKRGGKKFRKNKSASFSIFSNNVAGLKNKAESLKSVIRELNIAVFTIQETHFSKKGKFLMNDFDVFEAIRTREKGGTLIGVHKSLNPHQIAEYNDEFELLSVEFTVGSKNVVIISGHGPQESWPENARTPFFIALEKEVARAELMGRDVIIQMDSNSKLGSEFITGDPHKQTQNGNILAGVLDRHGLIVANGISGKTEGLITRRRVTVDNVEESIIDHLIFSQGLVDDFDKLVVDEDGSHSLENHFVGGIGSDHNPLISTFKLTWNRKSKVQRVELFNIKDSEGQSKFKEATNQGTYLSEVFDDNSDLDISTNIFIERLNNVISKCFKKVRITDKPNKDLDDLFKKRKILRQKDDEISKAELQDVEKKLNDKCAESNYMKIKKEIENIKAEEGGIHTGYLWKLKKKLSPNSRDPPTAMVDNAGNLITVPEDIDKLALNTFTERLRNRPIRDGLEGLRNAKEKLSEKRLKLAKSKQTEPWSLSQLDKVLKNLKRSKSRDPHNFANEIFHPNVAGYDLRLAILKLVNRIKTEQTFPSALEICNISAIYKNKSSRNNFNNYRGIFRVSIFRSILDRLIYNDEYENIDSEISDSNVGARKQRNIRDNLFVLGAVLNSVIKGSEEAVDLQVFDIEKCFDALWMQECINDIYELGLQNDKLSLLHLENQNAHIAIKNNQRITSRTTIHNVIMQGTVWGSLFCTASMEKLGKSEYSRPDLLYKYKDKVSVPSLGMIDDILKIQKCSEKSVNANAFTNAFVEGKKLQFSKSKCHRIHISKRKDDGKECFPIKVHDDDMKQSIKERYLGDIIDETGKIRATVEERKMRGLAIVSEIMAILEEIPLGSHRMEIGLHLRQAMLLNGILYNSEVWHSLSEAEIKILETVDEHLLRALVKAHSKTPLEFLYLESGAIPIRFTIMSRRILYLKVLLQRDDDELTKKIYETQKENPSNGDFSELVQADLKYLSDHLTESYVRSKSLESLKTEIKTLIRKKAFEYLTSKQTKHSKIKNIKYSELKTQHYVVSPIFTNEEVSVLYALRSRMIQTKVNFLSKHQNLQCPLCQSHTDDQQHIMHCNEISKQFTSKYTSRNNCTYSDIFSDDVHKQKEIAHLFVKLLKIRETCLEHQNSNATPSNSLKLLKGNNDLLISIDNCSLWEIN